MQPTRAARAPAAEPPANSRRRLERDLHDSVQNQLVALIVQLARAAQDPETPPTLATTLARIEAHAQSALDSVRDIARGIYPRVLADFGLGEALRAHAAHAAVHVSVTGSAPRSTAESEEAVYYACSEAIQNVAKHGGPKARVTLRLHHDNASLTVHISDDGAGFDPLHTANGAGLQNIHGRIEDHGGTVTIASRPGHGALLTITLPWQTTAPRRQ
jgi:signal transduction histidine kinase